MLFRIGDFMNKKSFLKKKFRDNFANRFTSPISTLVLVHWENNEFSGIWTQGPRPAYGSLVLYSLHF